MNDILRGISIYLIGMPGSGKTTVGRLLAQQLGYGFVDSDAVIEQASGGKTINEIFTTAGEDAFRELESRVLAELSAHTRLVISTGGGIILRQMNWSYLQHGLVVWLDVPVKLLMERLAEDNTRPLLKDPDPHQKLQRLFDERQPLYEQADIRVTVNAGETPEQIAERVMQEIPKAIKPTASAPVTCS